MLTVYLLFALLFLLSFSALWIFFQKKVELSEKKMGELFKSLSFDVMEKSSRSFLDLAQASLEKYQEGAKADLEARQKTMTATLLPIQETIKQLEASTREIEKRREGAYSALAKQLEGMVAAENSLRKETHLLVQALRSPQMRGSWGQIHLKRVVELAGLVHQCDFYEQQTVQLDGKVQRPDLIVRLPGERQIVIDAKTPLDAYLDASDAGDDNLRKIKLMEHASKLRRHMKELSSKEYWKQFETTPEYVILFLPAEAFFSAALQVDPLLIEVGADQSIIVATPTTLIAILRAIAYSWKQEGLSKSAAEIAKLGQEFYDRIGTLVDHWGKVGKNLNAAVDAYNQSLASFETRVLVTARKLKENASLSKEVKEIEEIDTIAKNIKVLTAENS